MGQGIKLHFDFSKHNGQNLWTYVCVKNDTSKSIYFLMKCLDLNPVCRFYEYPNNPTMVKLKERTFNSKIKRKVSRCNVIVTCQEVKNLIFNHNWLPY